MRVNFQTYSGVYSKNNVRSQKINNETNAPVTQPNSPSISFKMIKNLNYERAMLVILDGFGIAEKGTIANPFNEAKMPFFKSLLANVNGDTLSRTIEAAGIHVGLPAKMVGNSEVGHNNLGAGRLVPQDLLVINNALKDGSFYSNPAFLDAMKNAKENNRPLHLMGLLSDGHVHTEINHFFELIKMAKDNGVQDVRVHAFLDGRDVPEGTGVEYVAKTNDVLAQNGYEPVASIIGMKLPMDREKVWARTETAFDLLTNGEKFPVLNDAEAGIKKLYAGEDGQKYLDKDIPPRRTASYKPISDNDSVIFVNYRSDRTIQLTDALTQNSCVAGFLANKKQPQNLHFVCMSQYRPDFCLPIAFPPQMHRNTLTQVLSERDMHPFLCTESTKKAHLTFFFDGKRHEYFDGSSLHIVPSEKEYSPQMRLPQISKWLHTAIQDDFTKTIITNFANADMLGHAGNYNDCIKSLEKIDFYLNNIVTTARKNNIPVIITADHGNIEDMYNNCGHTNNPVPFITVLPNHTKEISKGTISLNQDEGAALKDVAPSFLTLLREGGTPPQDMTGENLFNFNHSVYFNNKG